MKKVISIFTAFTTVLWLSGVFMIFPVSAATFADGDLVRESDEFDVYIVKLVGSKMFKRLILNPDVFNMYGHLKWENIKVVADGTLADYTTSELVRADGDEKVYKLFPDGDVGTKKWVDTLDCFNSQGYDWDSVYIINSFDRDSYTTAAETMCGEEVVAGDITLSLASDTPAASTFMMNNYGVTYMKVKIAGSGTVSQITIKRSGAGDVDDFDNLYIYEKGVRLTSGRTISSSTSKATFINLSLTAPTTFEIVADLSATAGNVNYFEILSAADVTSNATVGGNFPIASNPMAISGTNAGTLTVERSGPTTRNVTIGDTVAEIARFKVTTATEGANIERVQLFNAGDVTNTLITDLKIKKVDGTVLATADQIGDNGYVTFVFDSPYYIKKGGNEIFYIYAKIGGVKPDRTIKFYLDLATDILGKGTTYGFGMVPTITSFDSDTYVTVTCKGGDLTLAKIGPNAGQIGTDTDDSVLLEFSMTAAADITIKRTRLFLCIDTATANGTYDTTSASADYEDMKIRDKDTGTVLVGPKDGSAINDGTHETACAATVGAAYEDFTDTFDMAAGETKTLQLTVDIKVANTDSGSIIAANAKIKAGIYSYATLVGTSGNVNYMKYTGTTDAVDDSAIAPSGDMVSEEMEISAASLAIALASTPSGNSVNSDFKTYIKGQGGVEAAGFIFSAGEASDIDISSVTLTAYMSGGSSTGATAAKWKSGKDVAYVKDSIAAVYLYDTTTGAMIPGTAAEGFSGSSVYELVEFTGVNWTIPAGEDRTMMVKVNIAAASTASASTADLFFAFDIEAAADVTATDKDGNSVTLTDSDGNTIATTYPVNGGHATDGTVNPGTDFGIAQRGDLAIAAASDTPERKILVMGSTDNEVSKFKLTGTNEAWYLNKFSVALFDADAAISGNLPDKEDRDNVSGLKLKYQTEAQFGTSDWTISSAQTFGAEASKAFSFTGDARPYVPKDDDAYITALVNITDYNGGSGAKSKKGILIADMSGSSNMTKAYGAQSGYQLTTVAESTVSDYYLHFVARSRPVFAKKAWGGGETELARFTITAEGHDVIFKNTDFDMGTWGGSNYTPSAPVSALIAFDVIASGTLGASTSFYLYDWTEAIISSAENVGVYNPITDTDAESNLASIGFHFEYGNKTITIPKGTTKEFHVDIGGADLTDFDNTDEYIYLKLLNDSGDDLATGDPNVKEIIYDDDTNEEGIGGTDKANTTGNPEERYMMPQDVNNVGSLPLIFRTLRGTVAP